MRFLSWVLIGLITGFIGNKIDNRGSTGLVGLFRDLILGVIGAIVGGYLFEISGYDLDAGVNPWSILAAIIGAIVLLRADHIVRITVSKWRRLFPPKEDQSS
jgi:uncharacterized membrane protein YeaQ/YmgE (transglycosylase-associated protein family)